MRKRPQPKQKGICPCCSSEVIAKCGKINQWHWSHRSKDCDPWYESETAWHLNWKSLFPEEWQEVVIGNHRADIKTPRHIIELQHSSISIDVIKERESFYRSMIWIFDVRKSSHNITINKIGTEIHSIRWFWPKRTLSHCRCPVLIHLGKNQLYNLRRLEGSEGLCTFVSKEAFMAFARHPDYSSSKRAELYPIEQIEKPKSRNNWPPIKRQEIDLSNHF